MANTSESVHFALGLIRVQGGSSDHPVDRATSEVLFDLNDQILSVKADGDATLVTTDKILTAIEGAMSNGSLALQRHSPNRGAATKEHALTVAKQHATALLSMATARDWDWSTIDTYMRQLGPVLAGPGQPQTTGDLRLLELTMELLAPAIESDDPSYRPHRAQLQAAFTEIATETIVYRWCSPLPPPNLPPPPSP